MDRDGANRTGENTEARYSCDDCDQAFKTAQGLGGHHRLAHSATSRSDLDAKESAVADREAVARKREDEALRRAAEVHVRETEVADRERQIAETGPEALGMVRCQECESWFESAENMDRHARSVHPIEDKVAAEVGKSRQRVADVWREAVAKASRHPRESNDQIVGRFWSLTDQKILRALLARNATFRTVAD